MKLFFHYCSFGFGNCYVLGSADAIIIDPGHMAKQLLEFIETNDFFLRAVLITHDHKTHVQGLRTLKRIYNTDVYAINRVIQDSQTIPVKDGDIIDIGPFNVEVISIPGHSADSVVYRIGTLLFTGDVLTTGLVGTTASAYGAKTQINKLRSRILSLPGDYTVLPGHGPPSTLEAERRFNADINDYNDLQNRKPGFKIQL
ncbi:MAG: MBL fold metallo-hydrolase [Treponema sp.]|nr:MBL fold metallo-hydrolase [Treponema sp.]